MTEETSVDHLPERREGIVRSVNVPVTAYSRAKSARAFDSGDDSPDHQSIPWVQIVIIGLSVLASLGLVIYDELFGNQQSAIAMAKALAPALFTVYLITGAWPKAKNEVFIQSIFFGAVIVLDVAGAAFVLAAGAGLFVSFTFVAAGLSTLASFLLKLFPMNEEKASEKQAKSAEGTEPVKVSDPKAKGTSKDKFLLRRWCITGLYVAAAVLYTLSSYPNL